MSPPPITTTNWVNHVLVTVCAMAIGCAAPPSQPMTPDEVEAFEREAEIQKCIRQLSKADTHFSGILFFAEMAAASRRQQECVSYVDGKANAEDLAGDR